MGFRKVRNMDVVADAGAVGSWVVFAINADGRTAAHGDVKDERDEVRFGVVGLAAGDAVGALGGASDVEIAQRGIAEAVNSVEPGEHVFNEKFGFAVDIGGL